MNLCDLPSAELDQRLRNEGVDVFMPPYRVRLRTDLPSVRGELRQLYADYPVFAPDDFCDFHIRLFDPAPWRFWGRQVQFALDEFLPFKPLPFDQAHAMLEWGLNWCIGNRDHSHLILHAGVVALGEQALVLAAASGSGKSTLSAALCLEGFRLLSDELCLLDWQSGHITAVPRPVSLKNDSIALIKARYPGQIFSRTAHDTRKGTVAHLKPPAASVREAHVAPRPALLVLPRYVAGSALHWQRVAAEAALPFLIQQSFNYHVLGERGFDTLLRLLRRVPVFSLEYSSLDEAIPFLREQLLQAGALHPPLAVTA